MIGALLYFVLGFAAAGLIATLLAPVAVRRAVTLTRRQVEANLPLSIDEIRAEKDKVRAELAMDVRRLEMDRDAANRARVRYEVKAHQAEEQRREAFDVRDEVKGQLRAKEKEFSDVSDQLAKANDDIDGRDQELQSRGERIEKLDHDLGVSAKNIEELEMENAATMMAREEIQSRLNVAEGERKKVDAQMRDLRAKLKDTQTDLREAKRDKTDAEKRLARIEKRADMLEEKLLSRKTSTSTTKRPAKKSKIEEAPVSEPQKKTAVVKGKTGASLNPKKNTLLQQSITEKVAVATMPKAAPLEITPIDTDIVEAAPKDETIVFEKLKSELEAIGEGKAFDREFLEEKLQHVAASMSAQATQENGMADILNDFEKRAAKAPLDSLARNILDARSKL